MWHFIQGVGYVLSHGHNALLFMWFFVASIGGGLVTLVNKLDARYGYRAREFRAKKKAEEE